MVARRGVLAAMTLALLVVACHVDPAPPRPPRPARVLNCAKLFVTSADIPADLGEAVDRLVRCLPDLNTTIRRLPEGQFGAETHMSVGLALRNAWLHPPVSRLRDWFKDRGVEYSDDMSGMILSGTWHAVRGVRFDFTARVRCTAAWNRVMHEQLQSPAAMTREGVHGPAFSCMDDQSVEQARPYWEKVK